MNMFCNGFIFRVTCC